LKNAWTWSHTIHLETNCWTCNCILRHQYYVWNKLYVCKTPKWPNSSWSYLIRLSHCFGQGITFTSPSTHIRRRDNTTKVECNLLA
jgi:hypothetical protein